MRKGDSVIEIPIKQHLKELKECKRIFRELQPYTIDEQPSGDIIDGRYTPYTLSYEVIADVVHQIREILRERIERG